MSAMGFEVGFSSRSMSLDVGLEASYPPPLAVCLWEYGQLRHLSVTKAHLPGWNCQMFDYTNEKVTEAVAIVAGLALLYCP